QYRVQRVIYRQGAYEVHYDAALRLAQPGAQSLQSIYASMIEEGERTKLPKQDLANYEQWLQQRVEQWKTSAPEQSR
ncbi:hypothetical protein ACXWO8_10140, partial [Streptococcus pyogenes]